MSDRGTSLILPRLLCLISVVWRVCDRALDLGKPSFIRLNLHLGPSVISVTIQTQISWSSLREPLSLVSHCGVFRAQGHSGYRGPLAGFYFQPFRVGATFRKAEQGRWMA